MRIAQISPLIESVPPRLYGGTERVVSALTEELVRQGHDVTLFASGDSKTDAKLVACSTRGLRLLNAAAHSTAAHILMVEEVWSRRHEFDIMHFHIDLVHCPVFRDLEASTLTTLHGRLDLPGLREFYAEFDQMPLVSISDAQRTPIPEANWLSTVHHGLPSAPYRPIARAPTYLAFLGRVCPEKRLDRAVAIAKTAGLPLKVAAKIDSADEQYFRTEIAHLLDDPLVEYLGEIGDDRKADFLANAVALLFPIDWPEPFGLVLIEAMAQGTPTIAYPCGSVAEIVEDGVTGFIADSIEEAAFVVRRAAQLDRSRIRQRFERFFTVERMARDYLTLYKRLLSNKPLPFAA